MHIAVLVIVSIISKLCFSWGLPGFSYDWSFDERWHRHDSTLDQPPYERHKAKAVIVALTRNRDIQGITSSVVQLEDRFNKNYRYPYVFLNDVPFSEDFKARIKSLTNASVQFGIVPENHWNQPDWIDESRAAVARQEMTDKKVIYGGSVSYRNMCRFYAGFFYKHELLKPFKYYWRIEPDVNFSCDLNYDPFVFMQQQGKIYGFTISLYEYNSTIPSLWSTVKEFIETYPDLISSNNAMDFISNDGGGSYNLCHFWSNFEIGDLDFWRSSAYSTFFEFLDKKGGFYYERWGDAPIHSIAVALFAKKSQIHFFDDIDSRYCSKAISIIPTNTALKVIHMRKGTVGVTCPGISITYLTLA